MAQKSYEQFKFLLLKLENLRSTSTEKIVPELFDEKGVSDRNPMFLI